MDAEVSLADASDQRSSTHVLGDPRFVVVRGGPPALRGGAAVVPALPAPRTGAPGPSSLSPLAAVPPRLLSPPAVGPRGAVRPHPHPPAHPSDRGAAWRKQ